MDYEADPKLTESEREELSAFLAKRHPPLSKEIDDLKQQNVETPLLHRILFDDMRRFQSGGRTRYVQFLNDKDLEDRP